MPTDSAFSYDWYIRLSKYNTLRYEDLNRTLWQNMGIGHFIRNDRFLCVTPPRMVTVIIRKAYPVILN